MLKTNSSHRPKKTDIVQQNNRNDETSIEVTATSSSGYYIADDDTQTDLESNYNKAGWLRESQKRPSDGIGQLVVTPSLQDVVEPVAQGGDDGSSASSYANTGKSPTRQSNDSSGKRINIMGKDPKSKNAHIAAPHTIEEQQQHLRTSSEIVISPTTTLVVTSLDPEGRSTPGNIRKILKIVTISNSFLLTGGILFLIFISREIVTFCQRDIIADIIYMTAGACFIISGIIQLVIDLGWNRSIPVGRYSTSRFWNIIITSLFLSGVFLEIGAFIFWKQGEDGVPTERIIQWFSSHLLLLASFIAIIINWGRWEQREDKLDAFGNFFFLCESVCNVFARYMTDINGGTDPDSLLDYTELRFELVASIFWILNAFFYLWGDVVRLKRFNKETRTLAE